MTIASKQPRYLQIAGVLRDRIRSGGLEVGERLPSFLDMYREYGASTATMQKVYDLLEKEELIERRSRSGIYVTSPGSPAQPPKKRAVPQIKMLPTDRLPDELQPLRTDGGGGIGFVGNRLMMEGPAASYWVHLLSGAQGPVSREKKKLVLLLEEDATSPAFDCTGLDGLLVYTTRTLPVIRREFPSLPCVSVLHSIEGMTGVVADECGGARKAVRHLTDLGHRKIGLLMVDDVSVDQRHVGYRTGLKDAGIKLDPRWIRHPSEVPEKNNFEAWSRKHMQAWLDDDWYELGCTAVLVQNDVAAAGAMHVLQQAGLKVPEQVSVIGFDGTEICDYFTPHLTSVKIPLREIGEKATEVLLQQIAAPNQEPVTVVLPTTIKEGESTAACPAGEAPSNGVLAEIGTSTN